ncbi:MAG: ribosome assembly factor SBDS [Candidatus Iainarchaeum archaeon]|uniref:Ribosome assembly factor SBDS n=1 Tax=Candidatus Iainarchaeum sp. TaxID=3101447 RepID=A0A497JJF6_9ARCH|nr:MAG: ribosome assembly factor SBDS [Candidatus Diapherotrites archaeon]
MVKLEDAIIARFEFANERFEILVDPNLAWDVRRGKDVDLNDLLAINRIFKDAKKGIEQSKEALQKAFNTTELRTIVVKIIRSGTLQLTTEQRRKMVEKKKREIIDLITKNSYNPQTNTPHPPQRIELALEQLKIHIDPFKPASEQAAEIVKKLKTIMPISMEKLLLKFSIPVQQVGKALSILHRYNVKKEEWLNDGSLLATVEIPAGLKQELINALAHATSGNFDFKQVDKNE